MNTVLVVDDNSAMRQRTANLLKLSGLRVIQGRDGVEAVEIIQDYSPDLAILDMAMPLLNGYEVCRLIKANPETWNMPVMLISSQGEKYDIDWALKQGADKCIGAPLNAKELVNIVKELLRTGGRMRESASADDWIKYGCLVLSTSAVSSVIGCSYFSNRYDRALAAFEEALKITPNHSLAQMYRSALLPVLEARRREVIQLANLQQTICKGCRYYHGANGLICAVHPKGPIEEQCIDWECVG